MKTEAVLIPKRRLARVRAELESDLLSTGKMIALTWLDRKMGDIHADGILCCEGHYIELLFTNHSWERDDAISDTRKEWCEYKLRSGAKIFYLAYSERYGILLAGIPELIRYIGRLDRVPFTFCTIKDLC